MRRRALLNTSLALAVWLTASGHTPYRAWSVYRRKHLLILTSKDEPGSFELGQRLAQVLVQYLPASQASVSRAPDTQRLASLLSSKQFDVALLRLAQAEALLRGAAPFSDYGPVPLRVLVASGGFVLVCRDDFLDRHAYLVASALVEQGAATIPAADNGLAVPVHPGALAYRQGEPLPD